MCNKIIGITGKSGSGKSTVAKELNKRIPNSRVIEIDTIGHDALCQPKILENLFKKFGTKILDSYRNIDRKKLGSIVFVEREKMNDLINETYFYISEQITNIIKETKGVVILDWILLPQDPIWEKCDLKILMESDRQTRKNKVIERDKITTNYFENRETTSIEYDKNQFDFIFWNDYSLEKLEDIINSIIIKI